MEARLGRAQPNIRVSSRQWAASIRQISVEHHKVARSFQRLGSLLRQGALPERQAAASDG